MKSTLLTLLAAAAVAIGSLQAAEPAAKVTPGVWTENYDAALKEAEKSGKPILIDFTGSDWCGWCIKLKKEIFDQAEFKKFAKDNVILVEIDFPRNKKQSKEQEERNAALAQQYGVQGFPTLIILDSKGKQIGEMGYMEGGPKPFIAELEKVIAANKK